MTAFCPHCKQKYEIESQMVGQVAQCTACKKDFTIAAGSVAPPPPPRTPPPGPRKQVASERDIATLPQLTYLELAHAEHYWLGGITYVLMVPLPFFFGHRSQPNVRRELWGKWPFLQSIASWLLLWSHTVTVVYLWFFVLAPRVVEIVAKLKWEINYQREHGVAVDWDKIMPMIWGTAFSFIWIGAGICFLLVAIKAAIELVSVALKIEENTGTANKE